MLKWLLTKSHGLNSLNSYSLIVALIVCSEWMRTGEAFLQGTASSQVNRRSPMSHASRWLKGA